jgi:hypothetical protein
MLVMPRPAIMDVPGEARAPIRNPSPQKKTPPVRQKRLVPNVQWSLIFAIGANMTILVMPSEASTAVPLVSTVIPTTDADDQSPKSLDALSLRKFP